LLCIGVANPQKDKIEYLGHCFAVIACPCWKGVFTRFCQLNFESAKIIPDPSSPYYPYGVAISNALPGWNSISVGILGDITVSVLLTPARQDEGRDGRVGT
jgi:hypothetical protein